MKQFIVVLMFLLWNQARACDICGIYMGITPYDNQSSIQYLSRYRVEHGYYGLNQSHRLFPKVMDIHSTAMSNQVYTLPTLRHGNHGGGTINAYLSSDYMIYRVEELRFKYFFHQRWELNFNLPYVHHQMKMNETISTISGIGDGSFHFAYHFIRKIESSFQFRGIAGTGVKLPTGKNYVKDEYGNKYSIMMQPGTGSTDIYGFINGIIGYKKIGLNLMYMNKFNGKNDSFERVSTSSTAYASLFIRFQIGDFYFMPSCQAYYEYTKGIIDHEVLVDNTGMNVLMLGGGLDVNYKQFTLTSSIQRTVKESEIDYNMANVGRINIGLTYNFKQSTYLLKNKKK